MSWTRATVAAGIRSSLWTLVTGALLAATGPDRTLATTLTMDDLPQQPVDGLVHPSGVEFGFTVGGVPDADATYNAFGPGWITYVQDPSIEGTTAGVLEVILPGAFPSVEFGLAVSYFEGSVNVELFDGTNTSLGVQPLFLNPLPSYAEGQFVHNGVGVSRMLIDMTPAQGSGASRFAYDNLTFVPEPTTAMLVLAGLAGFAMRRRARVR